jgi:O-acetyl-ADP-ribose deacetylase
VADELNATSIALPAIATGVCGYLPDKAAHIAVTALSQTPTKVPPSA